MPLPRLCYKLKHRTHIHSGGRCCTKIQNGTIKEHSITSRDCIHSSVCGVVHMPYTAIHMFWMSVSSNGQSSVVWLFFMVAEEAIIQWLVSKWKVNNHIANISRCDENRNELERWTKKDWAKYSSKGRLLGKIVVSPTSSFFCFAPPPAPTTFPPLFFSIIFHSTSFRSAILWIHLTHFTSLSLTPSSSAFAETSRFTWKMFSFSSKSRNEIYLVGVYKQVECGLFSRSVTRTPLYQR